MRILHIGDYHYKSTRNSQFDQNKLVENLIKSLKNKAPLDFIIFTGDLVQSGEKLEDFNSANASLLNRLSQELSVPDMNVILCQGNHDINRRETTQAVISFFDKCKSNDELNQYFSNQDKDFLHSLFPSNNYLSFITEKFSNTKDIIKPLYSIHKRNCEGKSIGIVTLNTSWLSSGFRNDYGFLQLPTNAVKEAVNEVKGSDFKIILLHHPLDNLKELNYIELQHLIHGEFDLMLSGHLHREQIITQYFGNNGIFWNTTQATLTYDYEGEIGYSIINYNLNELESISIDRGHYVKRENSFIDLPAVVVNIPVGTEKANQNKIRKKIIDKYFTELHIANQLLLNIDDNEDGSFVKLFTPPVLTNTDAEVNPSDKLAFINYTNLFNAETNYLIFGKDKCGKSSLLKRVQLHLLKNYFTNGIVPLYIDYKAFEYFNGQLDITKQIAKYYEINNQDAQNIISNNRIILLIDNLNNYNQIHDQVLEFIRKNENVKFAACSDYVASRVYAEIFDDLDYEKIFFKDLTRKEIRLYTDKQENIRLSDKEEVIERITKLCKELQLPVNYWTISLILLIYKKSNNDYSKNLFSILDLCVDEILNKKQLTFSKNALNFEQYKDLCSQIAHFLLVNYIKFTYGASYEDLIQFISNYIKKNPRISAETKEVLDDLLDTGILKKRNDNNYTFRLNGIFEYFLAYFIKENESFKNEIITDDSIYLSFTNELEIYSGFNRKDENFLRLIFNKTKLVFDDIIKNKIPDGDIDNALNSKIGEANEFADTIRNLKLGGPFSHETQDLIKDQIEPIATDSEVHLKHQYDLANMNYEPLEKYIHILSRVFKNSDSIENYDLVEQIFDYIIEANVALGIVLIDEIESIAKEENLKHYSEDKDYVIGEEMMQLMSRLLPIVTQINIFNGIGHLNMQKIIQEKINLLQKDKKENQFKLFILYCLLMDIDIKSNKDIIESVFADISLSILKVSILFKLNIYLAFKGYKNKDLEQFLKNNIQKAQLRLDNKIDPNSLQKGLHFKSHKNIIKSEKENG